MKFRFASINDLPIKESEREVALGTKNLSGNHRPNKFASSATSFSFKSETRQ
jgi:nuclear transport factor 2 (NTF2) superfamily protein